MVLTIGCYGALTYPLGFAIDFSIKCCVYGAVGFEACGGMCHIVRFFVELGKRFNIKAFIGVNYCAGSKGWDVQPVFDKLIAVIIQVG